MKPHIAGMPTGALQTNCFVLGCPETMQAAVFDCGGNAAQLLALATDQGYEVTNVYLTHAHIDHVAGLNDLRSMTDAPFHLHKGDAPLWDQAPMQGRMFGYDIEALPPIDNWVEEGDEITVGELTGKVLFLPGHAPGHVIYYFEDFATAFSGDMLFAGSIGRVDLPGCNPAHMRESLKRMKNELPDSTRILCGHGPETTLGVEKERNPFLTQDW
jgi:glyoxylase-like metal-dependent hydrolase (beta-lactamase superfamily II)